MKILFAHVVHSPGVDRWYQSIADAAGKAAEVRPFCITLDAPGPRLSWPQLDRMWRRKDRRLMAHYEKLREAAEGCDALLNYNGVNIHPGLLKYLPTYNVYACFDDPEASASLSKPVAAAFDAAFYGNIASRFQYESFGCGKLAWLPIFTAPGDVPPPPPEVRDELFKAERDVDIALVAARNDFRQHRINALVDAFPQARCFGDGFADGRISDGDLDKLYRRTRIGWNIHNSTGPINRRLFALAAYGVLPICDNKTGLGHIFTLGKEAVGFDTIPEAIALTRYYLEHESERRKIARAAYERFWRDYHAGAIWQRIVKQLKQWKAERRAPAKVELPKRRHMDVAVDVAGVGLSQAKRIGRAAKRAVHVDMHHPMKRTGPDERFYTGQRIEPYHENPEQRGLNMAEQRLKNGKPLDWPNILALNWAVASMIGDAKKIIEVGSGTGPFAEFAAVDPQRTIDCFEDDDFARGQAMKLRPRPNVTYRKTSEIKKTVKYELLVSVEVIEHVADLPAYLTMCRKLAPRAIFTTPNRNAVRADDDHGPPPYPPHVREYSAGELYWLLRQHYRTVHLFYQPDAHVPWIEPMTIADRGTPIIAECVAPLTAAKPAARTTKRTKRKAA